MLLLRLASLLFLVGRSTGSGVNQVIAAAADSSDDFELLQPNKTVRLELDMVMSLDQYVTLQKSAQELDKRDDGNAVNRQRRKGVAASVAKRWPKKEIPYELKACFSEKEKRHLYLAMADYHRYTCIRWRLAGDDDKAKVRVESKKKGCFARIGFQNNVQPINLSNGCRHKGTMIHEMLHTLGCFHEQSRPDRDDFVDILKDNIIEGKEGNFKKYDRSFVPDWGVPYAYDSVMHYDGAAFTIEKGKNTIVAKDESFQDVMGNRRGFVFEDIEMANFMYKCNETCTDVTCTEGFLGPDCKCWCEGPDLRNPVQYCDGSGKPPKGPDVPQDPNAPDSSCVEEEKKKEKETKTKEKRDEDPNCTDNHDKCAQFAANGECEKNLIFMSTVCRKSCRLCHKKIAIEACMDLNTNCADAAAAGVCHLDRATMEAECRKSCGFC